MYWHNRAINWVEPLAGEVVCVVWCWCVDTLWTLVVAPLAGWTQVAPVTRGSHGSPEGHHHPLVPTTVVPVTDDLGKSSKLHTGLKKVEKIEKSRVTNFPLISFVFLLQGSGASKYCSSAVI